MNILVVCHYSLYEDLASSFVHNPTREYVKLGHRVRVIVPIAYGKADRAGRKISRPLTRTVADGVELFDLRYVSLSSRGGDGFNHKSAILALQTQLGQILKDFAPDIIHAHTLGFDSSIGAWLKQKLGCPLVVTTHGGDTARRIQKGMHHQLKSYCDRADHIVSVSNATARLLAACGTATPITTIHNGFLPRQMEAVERDPFGLIQVGHLIPSKHFDTTIRAFSLLKDKYPAMTLTLVGQGHLREQLEELCSELGLSDRVRFTGQLPNGEVFARMCKSSFFVMASHPEGFGIVYLEAMAAGCAIVGTEGQGIADIIESGKNGWLVNPDDPEKIAQIIDDSLQNPEKHAQIAQAGQTLARAMTWDACARNYLALFETL